MSKKTYKLLDIYMYIYTYPFSNIVWFFHEKTVANFTVLMVLPLLPHLRHCLLLRRRPFRRKGFFGICLRQLASSFSTSNSASECEGDTVADDQQKEDPFGYDPNLKLVTGLSGPVGAELMERSPLRLDGMEKKDYLHLFNEQLRFEGTNFTAVRNLARRSRAKSMEQLIEEWEWQAEIEQNLFAALEKTHKWTVRACLKHSLVRECSRQLVKLTHAILCRGQHAIPTSELHDFLSRIVLLLNQTAFDESIAMGGTSDNKKKLSELFNLYIKYFLDADIARKCSIREWWYTCAAQLGVNPKIYPDIELFSVPSEIPTLLLMVLLNSCSFKPPTRQRSERQKESSDKPSSTGSKPSKRAKNWPHAFFIRDLAISQLSPHGFEGEKTGLCKMLCVHEQLLQYYELHEFECLHFPTYELPLKLPPRPWLDLGQCGPTYTYAQNVVRKLEPYPDMDPTEMMRLRVGDHHSQARPVFDALNLLGATPWIINKEMLCYMRRTLEMSYDGRHREYLRPLAVPVHPATFDVPYKPKEAWERGVLTEDAWDGVIVDEQADERQNRQMVLKLLKESPFWSSGKWRRKQKMRKSEANGDKQPTDGFLSLSAEGIDIEKAPPSLTDDQGYLIARRFLKKVNAMYRDKCEQNSLHCWLVYRLTLAQHFADCVLYFPHNIDFRGRAYPISPQINHMGDDLNRGLLKFAAGKPLGERGLEWLKLHCINITGRKKRSSLRERLKFAEENLSLLTSVANDPFDSKLAFWWRESEEPWQTLAACVELRDALSCDRPEDFVSHLPIHQDGSCNGLQHYAAMGRDLLGAREVNLLPDDLPRDLYSNVAKSVEEMRLEHENDEQSKWHQVAKALRKEMPSKIERKIIKQTIMTTVYGVTKYGARAQIGRQLVAIGIDRDRARTYFAPYLTHCAFESLTQAFSNSMALMEWFKRCAHQTLKLGRPMEWVTPLGLPVVQPYVTVDKEGAGLLFRPVPHKQVNAFPPNFVHSLDSSHMMLTALHCYRHGITYASVHDCFWTHACDVDEMNRICRDQFIALHEHPITEQLSQFFTSTFLPPELRQLLSVNEQSLLNKIHEEFKLNIPPGSLDITKVRESKYFFS